MAGWPNHRKIRQGQWQAVVEIEVAEIDMRAYKLTVVSIGHGREVYR